MIELLQRSLPLKVTIKFHNSDTCNGEMMSTCSCTFSHSLPLVAAALSTAHPDRSSGVRQNCRTLTPSWVSHTHTHTCCRPQLHSTLQQTTAMLAIQQTAADYRLTLTEIMTLYGTVSNTVIDGVFALIMQYAPLLRWCRPQSMADFSYSAHQNR